MDPWGTPPLEFAESRSKRNPTQLVLFIYFMQNGTKDYYVGQLGPFLQTFHYQMRL